MNLSFELTQQRRRCLAFCAFFLIAFLLSCGKIKSIPNDCDALQLQDMSDDAFAHMARFLPNDDLHRLTQTCKALRDKVIYLNHSRPLLHVKTLQRYPHTPTQPSPTIEAPFEACLQRYFTEHAVTYTLVEDEENKACQTLFVGNGNLTELTAAHRLADQLLCLNSYTVLTVITPDADPQSFTLDSLTKTKAKTYVTLDIMRQHPYFLLFASSTDRYCYVIPKINGRWIWTLPQKIKLPGFFKEVLFAGPDSPYLFIVTGHQSRKDAWCLATTRRGSAQNQLLIIDLSQNQVIETMQLHDIPHSIDYSNLNPQMIEIRYAQETETLQVFIT